MLNYFAIVHLAGRAESLKDRCNDCTDPKRRVGYFIPCPYIAYSLSKSTKINRPPVCSDVEAAVNIWFRQKMDGGFPVSGPTVQQKGL